ncbi:DUF1481 domain-containing protein [Pantoea sp. 1.19]|uniref:DUF1481 domain-containing protein n=1 Tax=Pantoea sp. 1.19 TaxID=1925589 RepID=UPI000948A6BE|nr:DUF1481 domain-containing protein [Pantoea sp. 1.19]
MTDALRLAGILLALLLLNGCSSKPSVPDFTASGYLADRGTVRIWRKNSEAHHVHIQTVYTPFDGDRAPTELSEYHWQGHTLTAITRETRGAHPETVTLRFDTAGELNYMQRQRDGQRQAVSDEAVALYQFDAQRMLALSDDLLAGRVFMTQGRWQGKGTVINCQGQPQQPAFDRASRQLIQQVQARSVTPVSVAWLEAPQGTQLILAEAGDVCASEPTAADF